MSENWKEAILTIKDMRYLLVNDKIELKPGEVESEKFGPESQYSSVEKPDLALFFLRSTERYSNDLVRQRGYLFLNEVRQMLHLPPTAAGQLLGWIKDETITFNLNPDANESLQKYLNGESDHILLTFNVSDSPIYDLI